MEFTKIQTQKTLKTLKIFMSPKSQMAFFFGFCSRFYQLKSVSNKYDVGIG